MDAFGEQEINAHYEQNNEAGRLLSGAGVLELARNQELIGRYLSPAPSTVLDVGGGAGVYSFWLAEEGHDVHLIDPVEKHIQQAREIAKEKGDRVPASIQRGDTRALVWDDESVDAVLLFGPLYHLTEREDRMKALSEAYRVVRPGGFVFVTGINRFASLLDGFVNGYMHDPYFREIIDADLSTGQHRNPQNHSAYFTTAFFHRPEELKTEVAESGFEIQALLAVQGPGRLAKDFDERWADEAKRKDFLDLIRKVECEPELLSLCPHFMVIGKKKVGQ